MTLTLSIDESLLQRAQKVAKRRGTDVPQLILSYLEELTSTTSADEEIAEVRRLSMEGKGRSRGWKFDRDQLHERP